jgi:hypothetical protein
MKKLQSIGVGLLGSIFFWGILVFLGMDQRNSGMITGLLNLMGFWGNIAGIILILGTLGFGLTITFNGFKSIAQNSIQHFWIRISSWIIGMGISILLEYQVNPYLRPAGLIIGLFITIIFSILTLTACFKNFNPKKISTEL